MIGHRDILLDAQEATYCSSLVNFDVKSRVSVADDLLRKSIVLEHPLDKELSHSFHSDLLRTRYKEGRLGTIMVSNVENGVIFLGLRKFGDEVKGDNLECVCLGFWKYWC